MFATVGLPEQLLSDNNPSSMAINLENFSEWKE